MADCVCLPRCPFFNDRMANMPSMAQQYKKRYCQGDSADCARHMIFSTLGRDHVPPGLFPNQVDKAWAILAER